MNLIVFGAGGKIVSTYQEISIIEVQDGSVEVLLGADGGAMRYSRDAFRNMVLVGDGIKIPREWRGDDGF